MDHSSVKEPSVVDSTSTRLAGLDLIETNLKTKNMDDMETDCPMVIPDTPDRMMRVDREQNAAKGSNLSSSFRFHRTRNERQFSNRVTHVEGSNVDSLDTESLFRRAELACMMSNSVEVGTSGSDNQLGSSNVPGFRRGGKVAETNSGNPLGISHPTRCRSTVRKNGKHFHDEGCSYSSSELNEVVSSRNLRSNRRLRSGTGVGSKLLTGTCQLDVTGPEANVLDVPVSNNDSASTRRLSQRRLVRNGRISPCNTAKAVSPVYEGKCNKFADGTHLSKGKGIDMASDLTDRSSKSLLLSPLSSSDQKLEAQNSFISPSVTENSIIIGTRKMDEHENPHGSSSFPLHIINPNSGDHVPVRGKGKEILDEGCQANGQESRHRPSIRLALKSARESNLIGDSLHKTCTEGPGWRTTQNHRKNVYNSALNLNDESQPSSEHAHENLGEREHVNLVETSPEINYVEAAPMARHPSVSVPASVSSNTVSVNILGGLRNNGSQGFSRGKRKSRSARLQNGESSASDIFGRTPLPLSGQHSNAIPTRNGNSYQCDINLPVIDVDELPSPTSTHNSTAYVNCDASEFSSSRDLQVEADALLARQVQEQLYSESLGLGSAEEVDASLAWSLQQEEDAQQPYFAGSRRFPPRGSSVANLDSHCPRILSSSRRMSNAARASSRVAQYRRNAHRRNMDLEARIDYLEALEAAFGDDHSNDRISNRLLHIQRDFNEGDYEILLSLDDDNHHHVGASIHQINNLPLSVIQDENFEETCAVCLEHPATGDTMRHLPCMHKFHKDCIDQWLRRKTSCPICKSGIT